MNWQQRVYERLRADPERWLSLGELFEEVRKEIPLHYAMRAAIRKGSTHTLPSVDKALWLYFCHAVNFIKAERWGGRWCNYTDQVRLGYVTGRKCESCAGPVIRASWASKNGIVCLHCTAPKPSEKCATVAHLPVAAPIPIEIPAANNRANVSAVLRDVKSAPSAPVITLTPGQKVKGALLVRCGESLVLVYRRTLARELKPLLNLSVNQLDKELDSYRDLAKVLKLHGKTMDILPSWFFARVALRAVVEEVAHRVRGPPVTERPVQKERGKQHERRSGRVFGAIKGRRYQTHRFRQSSR